MGLLLTDEHYQLGEQILEKGIKKDIEKNPKDEWYYRAMFWYVINNMATDRVSDILRLYSQLNYDIEMLKDIAFIDNEFTNPITIEEYYNILIALSEDDQKMLVFDIEDLPYLIKNQMLDVLKEKNYEQFQAFINNNTDYSKSFEYNTILAKNLILNRENTLRYTDNIEPFVEKTPESLFKLIYHKFPLIKDFDINKTHSNDEWKMFIETQKWNLGVCKYLYEDIFDIDDLSYDIDLPSSYYFIFEKIKNLVHNTNRRLLNIIKHIEVPQEACLVKRIILDNSTDYKSIVDFTRQIKQLASSDKAGKIALKIKSHFKNVFLVESCEEFGKKTRYEMFVSLLDDFVNSKPKPKDYQILAKTIYNSMYFIREGNEDKKLPWKSWYKEFCDASGCVYHQCYETQNYKINDRVKYFESIFPLDPKIKHDKKRK